MKDDSLARSLYLAAHAMGRVLRGESLTAFLPAVLRDPKLSPGQRGALQDLCYSTLRDYGRGDFFLTRLLERPLRDQVVHGLLLVALNRLETEPEHAHTVVDQAVEAVGGIAGGRFRGLVNAVLRQFLRRRRELAAAADGDEVARWRHPRWWQDKLRAAHPEHWQDILAAGNTRPPLNLRVNRRRATIGEYRALLDAAGIACEEQGGAGLYLPQAVAAERLPHFSEGWVSVQDWGAQQAAPLLDLCDGMRVLDACSAPGGKTAHMLELADIDLLALDADAARAARVSEGLARLGLDTGMRADVRAADCRKLDSWWDGRPFDRILADVPCSASGVVRRHPDAKWLRRPEDIAGFAAVQSQILDTLWQVLAPGGKLLYVTCSLFPEENSGQIAAFVARHPEAVRLSLSGAADWQLLPQPRHDGFYFALIAKPQA